jgi:EAL domain-containing protein (putative c-di-GMP-specific phosphodiesterase class I)
LGHTRTRILRWAEKGGLQIHLNQDTDALEFVLSAEQAESCLSGLDSLLGAGERRDTRALVLDGAATPTIADIGKVTSLFTVLGRRKGRWLVEMLADQRVFSHYQPIVSAQDPTRLHAHEALLRGRAVDGAPIGAGPILSAALESDLLFQTDLAARRAAVGGFAEAQAEGKLFINFNPTAIYDPSFCLRSTIALIRELNLAPERIVFEVVESEQHKDLDHLKRILTVYRDAGFQVALDDFGAGYSTYHVLEVLCPDYVKLDMSLVSGVHAAPRKQMILRHVIELCRGLGPTVLAEGVELSEDADWLVNAGVDYLQGYLFGVPAPLPRKAPLSCEATA